MSTMLTIVSIALVVGLLSLVAFVFLVEPFVGHSEQFRDSRGRKVGSSPRLD